MVFHGFPIPTGAFPQPSFQITKGSMIISWVMVGGCDPQIKGWQIEWRWVFPYHIPIFSSWYYIYIYLLYIYIYYIYIYPHWLMCTSQDFCCWTSQVLQMSPLFLIFLAYLHCSPNEQCSKSCVTLVGWGQDSVHGLWYNVGPTVISWFINPINYSYKYHKP